MLTNLVNDFDIKVNLETGKISYSTSKEGTNISFFGKAPKMKIEKTTYFDVPKQHNFDPEDYLSSVYSLELNVSQICNMKCAYCFAAGGTYGDSGLMSFQTSKKAIDLFYDITKNKHKHISICFFGGEPFLNFNLIREIVFYTENRFNGYDIDYETSTNGTIVTDEIIHFVKDYPFKIQVSLDGNQENHDKYRKFSDGTPTYREIVSNIKKMKESGLNLQIRSTICHQIENIKDFVSFYANDLNVKLYMLPVMSEDPSISLNEDDLNTIYQEYINIFNNSLKYDKYNEVMLNSILRTMILYCFETENLSLVKPRPFFCGAGLRMLTVDVSGDIFPCHGFVGHDQYNLGNVNNSVDTHKLKQFLDSIHIANKEKCLNCIARNFCGGGCSHFFNVVNKNIILPHESFCGFVITLYKLAIIFYVNMKEKGIPKELVKSPSFIELSPLFIELSDLLVDNE
jgi:uncharacterized protein